MTFTSAVPVTPRCKEANLRPGDVLVLYSLDRLSRDLVHPREHTDQAPAVRAGVWIGKLKAWHKPRQNRNRKP